MPQKTIIKRAAKLSAALLLGAGAALSIAGPALADGIGNSVHNCYGIWWNTDWDQRCSSPGASYAGRYKSVADCTSSGDNSLTVRRNQYSTLSHDGPDCTFQTVNVTTSYLGS
ncbi:hypothetical protein J2S43_002123 [Catenuloplanes nepalensis]|uniref:Uncharacterized protein n=1 Tax=Catenuloplanes nepalensis TaxID=587533 RepID=A0ABT9MRF8_9ACTN|nr:hypothetical protein [Catenuloplanes nepalensis]MDP9793611.1 hypothetical protein [Catenuloplanes nepalensis]